MPLTVVAACLAAGILLYDTLRSVDEGLNQAILDAAQDEARLIAAALTPMLASDTARTIGAVGTLDAVTREMAGHGRTLRVIRNARRESGEAEFLVAAHPEALDGDLPSIRAKLAASTAAGLDRSGCKGSARLAERLEAPGGTPEILAAATVVPGGGYCWTILVGWTAAPLIEGSIGRAYWQTPEMRRGAWILVSLATILIGASVWREGVGRRTSPHDPVRSAPLPSIAAISGPMAVAPGGAASERLREAAEASLLAARAPLSTLGAALEPLRESVRANDVRAATALDIAERSVGRLRRLLDSGSALDDFSADLASPRGDVIDLRKRVADLVFDYHAESSARGLSLSYEAIQAAPVLGRERLVDGVVTTLIDDALHASRSGDVLRVAVRVDESHGGASLLIEVPDHAGDPPDAAEGVEQPKPDARPPLWLASRHLQAMGGRLVASRRDDGTLAITAHWPAVS
ncbi:MAG: HAMP domain-containing histidine kinase [Alphaproteobacteria bacterium]|nr:HAMP domain-containing histidine kinase [Alphaproteobacteria bacterium]